MGKLTKNQKLAAGKIEAGKAYSLKEAASLVKEITFTKFDASLDIDVRLGVDPRKANQLLLQQLLHPVYIIPTHEPPYQFHEEVKQHLSPSDWPYVGQHLNVHLYPVKHQTWKK